MGKRIIKEFQTYFTDKAYNTANTELLAGM